MKPSPVRTMVGAYLVLGVVAAPTLQVATRVQAAIVTSTGFVATMASGLAALKSAPAVIRYDHESVGCVGNVKAPAPEVAVKPSDSEALKVMPFCARSVRMPGELPFGPGSQPSRFRALFKARVPVPFDWVVASISTPGTTVNTAFVVCPNAFVTAAALLM